MSTQVEGLDTVTIGEGRSVGVWTGGPTGDVNWGEGKLQMVFCCNVRGSPADRVCGKRESREHQQEAHL